MNPNRRSLTCRILMIAALSLVVPACGDSERRVPVFKASGKVLFEGKPLAGALVVLKRPETDSSVPSPMAITTEDGTFTLHTYEADDGAPAGDYLVAVSTAPQGPRGGILSGERKKATEDVLKGRYADPKTSGLKATIKSPETTLDPLSLTATGGATPKAEAIPIDR